MHHTEFTAAELAAIDVHAVDDPSLDLWRSQSQVL
jgi:hypothetical protein